MRKRGGRQGSEQHGPADEEDEHTADDTHHAGHRSPQNGWPSAIVTSTPNRSTISRASRAASAPASLRSAAAISSSESNSASKIRWYAGAPPRGVETSQIGRASCR